MECEEEKGKSIYKRTSAETYVMIIVIAAGAQETPALSLEGDSFIL